MCFRGTQKNHFFTLAPNLCRASRVPTYAQLWTCRGFAMLLCKLRLERLENVARSLRAPHYSGHPTCNSALFPTPHLRKVTYSLAFQFPRCGDLGGVGRGGGVSQPGDRAREKLLRVASQRAPRPPLERQRCSGMGAGRGGSRRPPGRPGRSQGRRARKGGL